MSDSETSAEETTIARDRIPIRLRPAIDVTPDEFANAVRSRRLLWCATAVGMFAGLVCINYGIILIAFPPLGPFATPVATGILAHLGAALVFKDSRKMATTRMKVYPNLVLYLNGREIAETDDDDAGGTSKPG